MERAGGMLLLGGPMLAGGAYLLIAWLFPQIEDILPLAFGMLLTLPVAMLMSRKGAFKLAYIGKQHQARARAASLANDTRSPIVYLRPFSTDETPRTVMRGVTGTSLIGRFGSFEEQLSLALEPIGPLVAIGKPGEVLPTPGAVRRYASDTDWQTQVQGWLSEAQLVILRPGFTEGLWWELREVMERLLPQHVLILVTRMNQSDYRRFAELCEQRLSRQLPAFETVSRWRRVNGFIGFAENWQPVFLPLHAPWLRGDAALPLLAPLHHALEPVFCTLGLSWQPAPWSRFRIIAAVVTGLSTLVFFLLYLLDSYVL